MGGRRTCTRWPRSGALQEIHSAPSPTTMSRFKENCFELSYYVHWQLFSSYNCTIMKLYASETCQARESSQKCQILSLGTSTTLPPTTWTQPTATRRTTPRKLQPASKRSQKYWRRNYLERKLMPIYFLGNWHLHWHGAVHHCSKTPWDDCRNIRVWGEQCSLNTSTNLLYSDNNYEYQLFQCADLDKAMQHYEQVAKSSGKLFKDFWKQNSNIE